MGVSSRLVKSNDPNPKKRFGQHFLRDKGVIDRIIRWIGPESRDLFVEIGAGDGALSVRLAQNIAKLIAVEVDRDCIPLLENSLASYKSASIVQADILQLNPSDLIPDSLQPGQKVRIAGNLPYNIATAIIERLLHAQIPVLDMYFMVQLEVAQRITANPGSRQYGYFSVLCQHNADVQMGFKISPACFVPRPKVASAIISFHPKNASLPPQLKTDFEALCKASFAYRRKTLENSLKKHPVFGAIASDLLNHTGIDKSRRAEDLSVKEYERLAITFYSDFKSPDS